MNEISSTNWLLASIAAGLATVALAFIYFASSREGKTLKPKSFKKS